MSTAEPRSEAFILGVINEFDHTDVARQDGRIRVTRGLAVDDPDGILRMDDVLDLASEHGLTIDDVLADYEDNRLYVFFLADTEGDDS